MITHTQNYFTADVGRTKKEDGKPSSNCNGVRHHYENVTLFNISVMGSGTLVSAVGADPVAVNVFVGCQVTVGFEIVAFSVDPYPL